MNRSIRYLLAALGIVLGLAVPAAAAYAGEDDNHHPGPRPGAACVPGWKAGDEVTIDTRSGPQTYRCEQRAGDPCPVWHWVFDPAVPKGQKKPQGCPQCPSSAPPPSPSTSTASAPPSSPPVSSAPPSSPASSSSPPPASTSSGPALPVTGSAAPPPWRFVGAGAVLLAVGAPLAWLGYRRPRRRLLAGGAATLSVPDSRL